MHLCSKPVEATLKKSAIQVLGYRIISKCEELAYNAEDVSKINVFFTCNIHMIASTLSTNHFVCQYLISCLEPISHGVAIFIFVKHYVLIITMLAGPLQVDKIPMSYLI